MTGRPPKPVSDRLLGRVTRADGCWLWPGHVNDQGYGILRDEAGRDVRAHRVAYEALVGPVPEGLELDHLCRVRRCVNPEHLEPVTHLVNVRRGFEARGPRTECKRGHPLTGDNVYVGPKSGKRRCVACFRASEKARWIRERSRGVA